MRIRFTDVIVLPEVRGKSMMQKIMDFIKGNIKEGQFGFMSNIERIKCGNGNCYLVHGDKGTVLIDTSRTEFRNKILQTCKNKDIKLIILTHGHIDHIQNAAFLSKELSAPIAIHKGDWELLKNNMSEPLYAHNVLGKLILALSIRSFQQDEINPFEPDVYLHEGLSLENYGVKAKVIELPGHTKGSVGIIVGETDIIVGDALMNIFYPAKSMLYGNREVMEQSAKRIAEFTNVIIHFGHGKPVKNRKWQSAL